MSFPPNPLKLFQLKDDDPGPIPVLLLGVLWDGVYPVTVNRSHSDQSLKVAMTPKWSEAKIPLESGSL